MVQIERYFKWVADDSKKGSLGKLQLNIPSSDSKPTIQRLIDTETPHD